MCGWCRCSNSCPCLHGLHCLHCSSLYCVDWMHYSSKLRGWSALLMPALRGFYALFIETAWMDCIAHACTAWIVSIAHACTAWIVCVARVCTAWIIVCIRSCIVDSESGLGDALLAQAVHGAARRLEPDRSHLTLLPSVALLSDHRQHVRCLPGTTMRRLGPSSNSA